MSERIKCRKIVSLWLLNSGSWLNRLLRKSNLLIDSNELRAESEEARAGKREVPGIFCGLTLGSRLTPIKMIDWSLFDRLTGYQYFLRRLVRKDAIRS